MSAVYQNVTGGTLAIEIRRQTRTAGLTPSVVVTPSVVAGETEDFARRRLEALFDAHHQRLYRLARRMSRNAEDARDLVQDTFLRAARAPASIPHGMPGEEAWLVRVLVNLCRDRWRQRAGRARLDPGGDAGRPLEPADVERAFIARALVQQALAALPPRRRAILVLFELEGAVIPEIARLLGVTPVTVRWHLSRGRRDLAGRIRGLGDEP